jgi:hypothetical protein
MAATPLLEGDRGAGGGRLREARGLALVATLLVLIVMAILVAASVKAAMTAVRTAGLEYHEARVFYASEAGVEAALSQLKLALQDGYLSDTELQDISPPSYEDFSFDSFSVLRIDTAQVEEISDGPYAGLYALTQGVEVYSLASDRGGNVSGVILAAKAQAIPIFQFGVFYNEDLEATNGPPMDFAGRVHSNGNIYLSSSNAWYMEMITTPNKVFHDRKDNHDIKSGVFIFNPETTDSVQLNFDSRTIPGPEAFKAASWTNFAGRLRTDAFNVDSLQLPLPQGVPAIELIRPRETGDGDAERSVKFAWNADTYVKVDFTNLTNYSAVCGGGPPPVSPPPDLPTVTVTRSAGQVPSASQICDMFPFRWSDFYDGREGELKDVLEIDVDAIDNWVGTDPNRTIEVIYVEFTVPVNINVFDADTRDAILDGELNPAVRMINGAELPNRMTVATEQPLYVWGNYNSIDKKPAALAGDGITLLSSIWQDEQNRPTAQAFDDCEGNVSAAFPCAQFLSYASLWRNKTAGETWVNAGVLAGHWPTPCDHEAPGCTGGYADFYGGGIENFPRFLEEWRLGGTRVSLHYRGALISPFTSQQTTGTWNGTYYVPPQRDWSFDTDFRDPRLLPPGTPNVGYVVRTAMREAF